MSKRKAVTFVALTVLGNCLGNLSSDLIRSSFKVGSRVLVRVQQQNWVAKEKLAHCVSHS